MSFRENIHVKERIHETENMSFRENIHVKERIHETEKVTEINKNQRRIGIISAPFNKGQPKSGTELGPSYIKDTGFIQKLEKNNFTVTYCGEVTMTSQGYIDIGPENMKNFKQILKYSQLLSYKVNNGLKHSDLCITLGGDHSIAIGSVNGLADLNRNHQVKVLWIDAHADIHTGATSQSKNMHGMPVAFLLDRETNRLNGQPVPCLTPKDIVYIALRDVDTAEQEFLDSVPDFLYFTMKDVRNRGINDILESSLIHLNPGPTNPLHLSFDIDALDPSVAPSTGTPVENGLTLDEGKAIVQTAYSTGFLRTIDIVEVNPALGTKTDAEKTAMAAHDLILAIVNDKDTQSQSPEGLLPKLAVTNCLII